MAQDRLYELAFRYKKAKLWRRLWDSDVFAVRFSDGETGYCCVMGRAGEFNGMSVFVGDQAMNTFQELMDTDDPEAGLRQDCLQVKLTDSYDLMPEQEDEVRAYAKEHGIRFTGKNAFPAFVRMSPYHYPWPVMTAKEEAYLAEAMEAAIWLAEQLDTSGITMNSLGFTTRGQKNEYTPLPLLTREDGAWRNEMLAQPEMRCYEAPAPVIDDELSVRRLKKLIRPGSAWMAGVFLVPEAMQVKAGDVPCYPHLLVVYDPEADQLRHQELVADYNQNARQTAASFVQGLLEQGVCPAQITVQDLRSERLLADLCLRAGITLEQAEVLPELNMIVNDMLHVMLGGPETDNMDELDDMDEETLRAQMERMLADHDSGRAPMPPELAELLRRQLEK